MTEAKSLNPNLTFLGFSLATKRPQAQGGEGTHKWFSLEIDGMVTPH
jgi:hypothetical protein